MHRNPLSSLFDILTNGNLVCSILVIAIIGFGITQLVQSINADRVHDHIESGGGHVLDVKPKPARYHRVLRDGKWVREEVPSRDEFTVRYVDRHGNERVADSSVGLLGGVEIKGDAISKVSKRKERQFESRIESLEQENANLRERVEKLQQSMQSEWKEAEPPPPDDPSDRKDA